MSDERFTVGDLAICRLGGKRRLVKLLVESNTMFRVVCVRSGKLFDYPTEWLSRPTALEEIAVLSNSWRGEDYLRIWGEDD